LRLIVNSNDNEALKRIVNYPARGIGQTTLDKLEQTASQQTISIWEVSNNPDQFSIGLNKGTLSKVNGFIELINTFRKQLIETSAYEVTLMVARQTGILEDLYHDKTPENLSKFENVQELLNAIQDFSINALEEGRPNRLENYLEEVALLTDQDTNKEEDRNRVTLMTVHSAKGLEFKNVFIVGLEEKLFPSNFSGAISPENLEEERRLFYVALTRAMKNACLSYARQRYSWGQLNFCEPSRFINEIDSQYLNLSANQSMPSFLDHSDNNFFAKRNFERRPSSTTPPKRTVSGTSIPQFNERLTKLKQAVARPSFDADDASLIEVGSVVEHQRFGRGKVIEMEGIDSNKKATVLFENSGMKQLLLKFARLKIIQ
jgi:DNA helicase-2/ATP-dependent DNA helicase PcrA